MTSAGRRGEPEGPAHTGLQRPPFLARQAVILSAQLLPAGSTRHRYRQELLAELHGLPARQATTCALGIAVNAPALRKAVLNDPQATTEVTMHTHRPLVCRFNLHHHYRIQHTEDGGRYLHCPRCGKDHFSATDPGAKSFFAGA